MTTGMTAKDQAARPEAFSKLTYPVSFEPTTGIAQRVAQAHELILKVTSDLSDEQLRRRPAPVAPALAPAIGWHLWHIARWADVVQSSLAGMTAELRQRLGPGQQVWEAEDLLARWRLGAQSAGFKQTGTGLDDDASTSLTLPGKEQLLDYARKAFAAADRTAAAIDDQRFRTPCTDLYGRESSVGTVVLSHLSHANRHLGMIEALRGVLGVQGTATI